MIRFHFIRCAFLKIPKGFQPSAQGCEKRATLGGRAKQITTLKELWRQRRSAAVSARPAAARGRFERGRIVPAAAAGAMHTAALQEK